MGNNLFLWMHVYATSYLPNSNTAGSLLGRMTGIWRDEAPLESIESFSSVMLHTKHHTLFGVHNRPRSAKLDEI